MVKPGMYISDRYEIIEKIGSGGMADVYKAKCHRLNRYVAIKILKQEFSNDKNFITKFRGEAQSAAGLSHPNIVSVYDVGDDEGLHYIVMELVEGITLKKFIEKKGRLEIKEAVGIAIQIAQGMEAAHENHIIHRDIKPQNIIISRDGKVKVADFGIAKVVSANTYTQNAIGSVHYLSPEQARGGYSDEKSDIYSLGVTLYEMLSGQLPFAGDNTVSVALLHIQSEAMPVRELIPSVPYSLDRIVQKCMQKKPENRYLSASDLILDLKRSITNPDGDFVKLTTSAFVPDNPTRKFSDTEIEEINASAAKTPATRYDGKRSSQSQVLHEEDEELDSMDSRWEKVILVSSIVVAIGLTISILYLIVKFFGIMDLFNPNPTPTPTPTAISSTPIPTPTPIVSEATIPMPGVIGYTFDDAVELLQQKSPEFQVLEDSTVYSTEKAGTVIDQYPPKDADVLLDQTIRLTVSAGPEPMLVPRVIGLSELNATQQLSGIGLDVSSTYEANETMASGSVIRTIPAEGENIFAGGKITIVVSTGRSPIYRDMKSILGMTPEGAATVLEEDGLLIGKRTEDYSDTFEAGYIISQSVPANTAVEAGTAIDIVVSLGKRPAGEASPTPVPTTEPTPTPAGEISPTPTPTPTTAPTGTAYYNITLPVDFANPIPYGSAAYVYLEIKQDNNAIFLYEEVLSYEEFPTDQFTFRLEADMYPDLTEGDATVALYITDSDGNYESAPRKEWWISLEEFIQ